MMSSNFIFSNQALLKYREFCESDIEIKVFFNDEIVVQIEDLIPATIFKTDQPPGLTPPNLKLPFPWRKTDESHSSLKLDFENAKKLYESMDINRVQASDPRLWSYLCLVPYFDYVKKRYSPRTQKQEHLSLKKFYSYKNSDKRTTIRNYIKTRFFTDSDNRSLRRNGLSTLWWAVELTHTPWKRFDGINQISEDIYYYTRILLNDTDLHQNIFERAYGKDSRVIFPLMNIIKNNKLDRKNKRVLYKKLNSDLAVSNYSVLTIDDIEQRIESILNS